MAEWSSLAFCFYYCWLNLLAVHMDNVSSVTHKHSMQTGQWSLYLAPHVCSTDKNTVNSCLSYCTRNSEGVRSPVFSVIYEWKRFCKCVTSNTKHYKDFWETDSHVLLLANRKQQTELWCRLQLQVSRWIRWLLCICIYPSRLWASH